MINIHSDIQPTQKDVKTLVKKWGYLAKFSDGEVEVYPKGKRGSRSYFASDSQDAVRTAREEAIAAFRASLEATGLELWQRDALASWFERTGTQWRDALYDAWCTGNYRGSAASSELQALRNSREGYALVASI
jgi:hypothetical protein